MRFCESCTLLWKATAAAAAAAAAVLFEAFEWLVVLAGNIDRPRHG